jgi:hypothetical protein
MQIATSDCTDEWKSKRRDQPELFSLLRSETAHQHLHRLQKPDEQANSRKVKERRISALCLVFGANAQRVLLAYFWPADSFYFFPVKSFDS